MPNLGVRVEGLDELRKAVRTIADKGLTKQMSGIRRSAAQIIVDRAMPNVPEASGELKRSVRALASGAARASAPHAGAVHGGRQRGNVGRPPGNRIGRNPITGRPFLWDAAQRNIGEIEREAAEQMQGLIEQLGRRR